MQYQRPHKYTPEELADYWRKDLISDAEYAEKQAQTGPFYHEKAITKETLLGYAAKCRADANKEIPLEFRFSRVG